MKINKPDNAAHILEKIIHISLSTCLIFLIFPRFTTLKDILLLTSVFCWVWLGLKHNGSFLSKDRTTISLSFFVIIAFISSVAGVEPLENLRRFKGEIIVPFLLFLIISSMYRDKVKALDLLRAPAVAFAMYTIYVLINYLLNYDVTTFLHKNIREMKIFDSYPQRSITLFPITVGIFLSMKNRSKYLLLTAAVLGFTIIAAYSSFTPLVSALSVLLLCAVFVQPEAYKIALRTSMAGIVVLIIILAMFKI
ncbi:MAG: hypothetical protein HY758_02635, partial [Nitrospirae bacterium]|nr:hypothetical protein [Nitrospirota bacterium]